MRAYHWVAIFISCSWAFSSCTASVLVACSAGDRQSASKWKAVGGSESRNHSGLVSSCSRM